MTVRLASPAAGAQPVPGGHSKTTLFLFLALAVYLAVPVVDVPLFGLSLSAPLMFLVALAVFLRPPAPWFSAFRLWIGLALLIWVGIFISIAANSFLSGGTAFDPGEITALVQFSYWLVVFVSTTYLVASADLGPRAAAAAALGTALLAGIRWGEAVFGGAIGAWMHLSVMSQNGYGIQFSTFSAALLVFVFGGKHRWLAGAGTLLLAGAVLVNGSRSSWIAVLVSVGMFLWMYLRTQRRAARGLVVAVLLGSVGMISFTLAPPDVRAAFDQRFGTLENIEEDKSYAVRQLMDQKGLLLFEQNPWFGIGISRWTRVVVPLELPNALRFSTLSRYEKKSSHNSYIGFLAETGLAGAIPLALLILFLAVRGYFAARNLAARGQLWALGAYAGFIGMSVHLWTLSGLTGTAPWFVYGLVAAVIQLDRQPQKGQQAPG